MFAYPRITISIPCTACFILLYIAYFTCSIACFPAYCPEVIDIAYFICSIACFLAYCPEVTLCGRRDVRIRELTLLVCFNMNPTAIQLFSDVPPSETGPVPSSMEPVTICGLLFFISLVLYYLVTANVFQRPLPPGPRGLHSLRLLLRAALSGTLHLEAEKWARQYGDVVMCHTPGRKLVFLNSR